MSALSDVIKFSPQILESDVQTDFNHGKEPFFVDNSVLSELNLDSGWDVAAYHIGTPKRVAVYESPVPYSRRQKEIVLCAYAEPKAAWPAAVPNASLESEPSVSAQRQQPVYAQPIDDFMC